MSRRPPLSKASKDTGYDSDTHAFDASAYQKHMDAKRRRTEQQDLVRARYGIHAPGAMADTGDDDMSGDAGPSTQFAGGGGGRTSGSTGAAGVPIPMMHPQNTRSQDHTTMKFAGTTWITPANSAGGDNVWCNFPWEYPRLFGDYDHWAEIYSSHAYWKASKVSITFKNPLCVQNLGTTTAGLTTTGQNVQAQLFGYNDDLYTSGIVSGPTTGFNQGFPTIVQMQSIVNSWRNHGYDGGAIVNLNNVDVIPDAFDASHPDVKTIGMGPGQAMTFGWNIHSPYWRSTNEFYNNTTTTTGALMVRWDEHVGIINELAPVSSTTATTLYSSSAANVMYRQNGNSMRTSALPGGTTTTLPSASMYVCPDPIPKLFLQLQPQLNSLDAGTGDSRCQLQWEMSVDVTLMGRVPRKCDGLAIGTINVPNKGGFAGTRYNNAQVPVFKPVLTNSLA